MQAGRPPSVVGCEAVSYPILFPLPSISELLMLTSYRSLFRFVCATAGVIALLLGEMPVQAQSENPRLQQIGRLQQVGTVDHLPIDEMSGLVKSAQFDNVWWVHNDSGDEPRLFAIDSTGSVHIAPWRADDYAAGMAAVDTSGRPAWPGLALGSAAHIDYETMAIEDGVLYLGDIGNNGNAGATSAST